MNTLYAKKAAYKQLPLAMLLLFVAFAQAWSQAPTGLTYPTPALYNANVSNVFLSPNVAGSVTSYSLPASPALPAGLSFDTNTGIISGMPTAAIPTTRYTITATNASGSTQASLDMTVTNNFLNNDYKQLHFGGTGVTVIHYPTGSTGQAAGDITLYKKITTLGGQDIDCIVTTKAVTNVNSWQAYDQESESGDNFSSNSPDFFAPQVDFKSAGSVAFDFQFILGNSYNNTTKSGINVVLQKVKLNTYDIDGNSGDGTYQYNEFGGFQTSELLASGSRVDASYEASTGLTRFTALDKDNSKTVTDPKTRVRVTYDFMSKFTIVVGAKAGGLAFFFLDFSAGAVTFTGSTLVTSPSVDLNKATTGIGVGVDNEGNGCGDATNGLSLAFTIPSEKNIQASPATLRQLDVSFQSGDILNGTNEKLVVGTKEYTLNAAAGALANVTVGIEFKINKTVSGNTHKFEFTKKDGSTFTVDEAEALLDALKYKNDAATRTAGSREFIVNVYNTDFKSPDAVFTAVVNCVSISGHIWRDANGLLGTSDFNTISANSPLTGQLAANGAYAILVNPATNNVIASKGIDAGGAFSFGNVSQGSYILYVSNEAKTVGASFTQAILPAGGYTFIGENLGAGAGSDLLPDGKLIVTVGSTAITDANFGLDIAPVANDVNAASQANPGGTQKVTVPNLNGTDPEDGTLNGGTGNTIKITSIPSPTEQGVLYYDGNAITTVNTVIQNYDPSKLKVDPINGNVTVVFTYQEIDAAGLASPNATVRLPFTDFSIGGKVYHDTNGTKNSLIDGTLISNPDQTQLYANLVIGGVVVGSVPVTNGAYSFTTANGLQTNTASEVIISTIQGVKNTTTGTSAVLPGQWVNTADGAGTGDGNANGKIWVTVGTTDITTGLDFGIEQAPIADPKSYVLVPTAFSATTPSGYPNINFGSVKYITIATSSSSLVKGPLSGSDAEDCAAAGTCNTGKSFLIGTINSNTKLYYNFGTEGGIKEVTSGTTITNYDPTLLIIYALDGSGLAGNPFGFTYSLIDAAGVKSTPVNYTITTSGPLPVTIAKFQVSKEGTSAQLTWSTAQEKNSERFDVQHSSDAKNWVTVGSVAASGNSQLSQYYSFNHQAPVSGTNYYRLKMIDLDATFSYSTIRVIDFAEGIGTRLYPNPVSDKLIIEDSNWASVSNVGLYNITGSMVYENKGANLNNEVNVKSLAAGTYILRISRNDGSVFTKKIAVVK